MWLVVFKSQLSPYVWDIMSFVDSKLLDSDAVFLRDDKVLRSDTIPMGHSCEGIEQKDNSIW